MLCNFGIVKMSVLFLSDPGTNLVQYTSYHQSTVVRISDNSSDICTILYTSHCQMLGKVESGLPAKSSGGFCSKVKILTAGLFITLP